MTVKGTPAVIARIFRRYANTMERHVREAERESVDEALQVARELSSGPYSLAMLRALGHPYARARPNPPQDAAIINVQTGVFRESWEAGVPRRRGTVMRTRLTNTAPHARFLPRGTTRMIERPILTRIGERMRPVRRQIMRAAVAQWLKEA